MKDKFTRHPSSYRDPSGFLFYQEGILYRQVNQCFKEYFDQFINSGLYARLVENGNLVSHTEINGNLTNTANWYKTVQPQLLPFISYPYEWCFDMWKDGALLTLQLAREAMESGMMLRDASAYNVQWVDGRMKFIDTLSFERYDERLPWIAYRQFCEHFLAPLALMHYRKEPFQPLFYAYPDGIPVSLAKKLLPFRSKLKLDIYLHLHLHGAAASKPQSTAGGTLRFSKQKMKNLLRSLEESITSFSFNERSGTWSGYYEEAGNRADYLEPKKEIISRLSGAVPYHTAIDLGANEGEFAQVLAHKDRQVVAVDYDHYSINRLYQSLREKKQRNILPLVMDLAHPSPALGVNNTERAAFTTRMQTGLVLALALIHHLCIGKNIPFGDCLEFFKSLGNYLIIEFVPKEDEKIRLMLQQKKDIYDWYTEENFLAVFSEKYKILESARAGSSGRTIYLMQSYGS